MRKSLLVLLLVASLVAAALAGAGCKPAEPAKEDFVVAIGTDASTFDPHFCTDSATEVLNKNIYSNLVRFTPEMQIEPDLATDWSVSDDGLIWTFQLRQKVKFTDGTPFDAAAVKTVLERVLNKDNGSPRRSVLAMISNIEAVDPATVKITTSYPCGSFLQQLAHPVAAIISPAAIEQYGKDLATHPVGTGAFELAEWKSGDQIVMERNDDYYGGAPAVKRIIFKIVPEDASRAMLLEAGEIDMALRLPITDVERLRSNSDISLIETPTVMTIYFALNCTKGPLQDARVRQALNYAADKEAIVRDIMGGQAQIADAPISPATWGYSQGTAYAHDVEKAKALLAEAGYPDGFTFTLWTPSGRYLMDRQIAEVVQAQLAEVGVTMEIQVWEFQALMEEVKKGQFDAVLLGWSPSTGDADQGLYPVFHSTQWPPGSNRAHYKNTTVDELLVQAKQATDPQARLDLYKQIETTIMDEAPWLFLHYQKQVVSTRSNVKGLLVLPTEHILFEKVSFSSGN